MSNFKVPKYRLTERRIMVERMVLRGLKPSEILQKIQSSEYRLDNYRNPLASIKKDIRAVQAGWNNLIRSSSIALQEYLAKQEDLRAMAIADKDYGLAHTIDKSVAKILGVDVGKADITNILNVVNQESPEETRNGLRDIAKRIREAKADSGLRQGGDKDKGGLGESGVISGTEAK